MNKGLVKELAQYNSGLEYSFLASFPPVRDIFVGNRHLSVFDLWCTKTNSTTQKKNNLQTSKQSVMYELKNLRLKYILFILLWIVSVMATLSYAQIQATL